MSGKMVSNPKFILLLQNMETGFRRANIFLCVAIMLCSGVV